MNEITKVVQTAGRRMTAFGIITIIAGIASIAMPFVAGVSVVVTVGILLIAVGILRMIWAFAAGTFGRGLLAFAIGGLTLLCGLSLASQPILAFGLLTVLIAMYLFADGLAEIGGAFRLAPESGRGWMILGGVVSILLGILMWQQFPLSGGLAIGIFLGIKLLFIGIQILTAGTEVRTISKVVRAA